MIKNLAANDLGFHLGYWMMSVCDEWKFLIDDGYILAQQALTHWGRDDIFKCIFLNENVYISINISLKFVPKGPINNIPALVPIMAWRRSGDKPLSEPMMASLLTHICVTRPQWVKLINLTSNRAVIPRLNGFDFYDYLTTFKDLNHGTFCDISKTEGSDTQWTKMVMR